MDLRRILWRIRNGETMARPSKRLAVLLCLLVLHQEFIQARISFHERLEVPARFRPRRSSMDILEEDRHEFDQSIEEIEARHGISLKAQLGKPLHRGKRFFFTFLFIVSIIVTVAATVVETVYDIAGCCGLSFHFLCGFESDFNNKKAALQKEAEKVDQRLQDALQKRDDLECLSEVLKSAWNSIQANVKLQEELLGTIDPNFARSLEEARRNAQKELENSEQELSENDISNMFLKKSGEELALSLGIGWTSAAVPGIALAGQKAYKTYKINKAYKVLKATKYEQVLKAAPKARKLIGFTESSAKLFLKNTAVLKFSQKAGSFLKAMKVFKVAGAVMSVISIALDLFNIISTFIACQEKSDNARESCKKLDEAETKVTTTRNNVIEFENILRTGMEAKLLEELRNYDFQTALTHIKETIENLPPTEAGKPRQFDTEYCSQAIPEFLTTVNRTGSGLSEIKEGLLDITDNCLDKLTFSYECLKTRISMNTAIRESCLRGSNTFEEILAEEKRANGASLSECKSKNEPFTTDEMFKQSLEAASRQEKFEFYSENCKMNSPTIQHNACSGGSVSGITPAQKQKIIDDKCEGQQPPKISAKDRQAICFNAMVFAGDMDQIVAASQGTVPGITAEEINALGC